MSVRWRPSHSRLSTQTSRLPKRGAGRLRVAVELLLQRVPQACHINVGALSGTARVPRIGGSADLGAGRPAPKNHPTSAQANLSGILAVSARTILRWRTWWNEIFPATSLWQTHCSRFMPPVAVIEFPSGLMARFAGVAAGSMMRFLAFLAPLTVRQ
jgi:hypothetical protein